MLEKHASPHVTVPQPILPCTHIPNPHLPSRPCHLRLHVTKIEAILWLTRLTPPLLTPRNHRVGVTQLNAICRLGSRSTIPLSPGNLAAWLAQLDGVGQRTRGRVALAPCDDGAGLANGEAVLWLFKRHVGGAGLLAPDNFAARLRHGDVVWVGGFVARLLAPDDLAVGWCDLDVVRVRGSVSTLAPGDYRRGIAELDGVCRSADSLFELASNVR